MTPGQLLMRRRALAAAGRFDTTLVLAQDWDMWLRLTARGDIAFVNKVVLQYRVHGGNRSLQYRAMHRAMVRIYRTYSASRGLSKEQRHAMRAGYCWHHWFTSQSHWGWARECAAQGEWREAILHALSVQAGLTRFCLSFARLWIAMQPHKPRHRL